jgi:hypothetical protein
VLLLQSPKSLCPCIRFLLQWLISSLRFGVDQDLVYGFDLFVASTVPAVVAASLGLLCAVFGTCSLTLLCNMVLLFVDESSL